MTVTGRKYRRAYGLRNRILLWIMLFSLGPLAAIYYVLGQVLDATNMLIVKDAVDYTESKATTLRASLHVDLQTLLNRHATLAAGAFEHFLILENGDREIALKRLTNEAADESAQMLVFEDTGLLLNPDQLPPLPASLKRWSEVLAYVEERGFIHAAASLSPAGWRLLVVSPLGQDSSASLAALRSRERFAADVQSKVDQSVARLNMFVVSLFLALGLAALFLARRLTTTLTRPFEQLARAMEQFDGTKQMDIAANRRDEIGLLTSQFAEMTGKLVATRQELAEKQNALEKADSELMRLNLTLEERIRERTTELEAAFDKLRELDKNKDDFISLVSHELKTPLTSISASAEALLSKDLKLPDADREQLLAIVRYEADRLSRLINILLDMTRLEAGRMIFNYRITNLAALVRQNAEAYRLAIEQKGLKLEVEIASDPRLRRALVDADRVIQALTNLLSNSIKFTERGRITVSLNIKEIGAAPFARLVVSDTGIGIRAEDAAKVFDRFQQIEKLDTHHEGLGLGMPLSKMLIEAMGGEIRFASLPNSGTAFTVTLPLDRPPGRDPTLPAAFNEDF